jgi:hypothetical protein
MESDSSFEEEQDNIQKQLDGIEHDEVQAEGNYFTWPKTMDTLLLEVLREHKVKWLKYDRNFQGEAYRIAIEAINKKYNYKITKEKS